MVKKTTQEQRRELGAFLLSRRARLDPEAFGMPKGTRRTPGLRREEVAMLAGVSVSWYTWLEQGREIKPSSEALQRIAKVLRLNRVESSHLFALSPREEPEPRQVDMGVSDGLDMLVRAINPIPAYVRNARLDILAWNDAIADLFIDYSSLQPHERNTLRLLFLYQPYRTLILDWEQMARGMISVFRASRARAQNKAHFDALIDELSEQSPEFREWWQDTDVQGMSEGSKRLAHPTSGHIEFTYVALTPEGRPDLSLVTYIPRHVASDHQ
ncbi:XRE family transcriptional regulator [Pantoea sp. RIT-PI-b]|uniref:helix-turn-helix transcriptional regulator n=1 Tax=unclassified Pantoea TaxID=2630326 RepID=UPI00027133BB|nr:MULTISPECIES: helix-turn-helix transcriptional regulator [unclassified Pantoea]EJL93711.1 putative transcriptional regulator [Pantoea sp. GM01]KNC05680.1 XRE family transcriptional regulator [Pantoea sp. RIT-PI-b]